MAKLVTEEPRTAAGTPVGTTPSTAVVPGNYGPAPGGYNQPPIRKN